MRRMWAAGAALMASPVGDAAIRDAPDHDSTAGHDDERVPGGAGRQPGGGGAQGPVPRVDRGSSLPRVSDPTRRPAMRDA